MTPLDRMIAEDAAALAHVQVARTRARTDIRRTAVLLMVTACLTAGYLTGHAMGETETVVTTTCE